MRTQSTERIRALAAEVRATPTDGPVQVWSDSLKTDKSVKSGDVAAGLIIYLVPGVTCPYATDGCIAACFGDNDNGSNSFGFKAVRAAMLKRTALLLKDPERFKREAVRQVLRKVRGLPMGAKVSLRMNGTSDVEHLLAPVREAVIAALSQQYLEAVPYEYTKRWSLLNDPDLKGPYVNGVHITLSASEHTTDEQIRTALERGFNVAIPVAVKSSKQELPQFYRGFPAIDGDSSDFRPKDPQGVIVLLRYKNKRKQREGFIRTL